MINGKRQILFVDDDPLITNGFKRSVDEYENDWDPYFTNSGLDALKILSEQQIDVIITDIKMPAMDGNELLEKVIQLYPGIMRFVLSGNIDEAHAIKTTRYAHQLIVKPCDIHTIRRIVENSCRLGDMLSNPNLKKRINGLKKIPSLPSLYSRLVKELESDDPDPKTVGDIISQDIAMTAKILQLVNSAFFGLPNEVVSAQRAATILGTNTIKALVLGNHIFSEYQSYGNPAFSIDELWHHSLIVGNLSKMIAGTAGLDKVAQGQAQLAGVLHDIGKLLQLEIPGFFSNIKHKNGLVELKSEYEVIGTSHAEMGAYLLGLWGLPNQVVEAVAYHHFPSKIIVEGFAVTSAVHIANGLYHKELSPNQEAGLDEFMDIQYIQNLRVSQYINNWGILARNLLQSTGILAE
jgi:putative nucleotidyltransferase with HDIG domain